MSTCGGFSEETNQQLRRMQRQMRMMDLRLQLLRERLRVARLNNAHHCCPALPEPRPPGRRILQTRLDLGRRTDRMQKIGRMLNSSLNQSRLALIDVKDFDPDDISVMVKDRKVTVLAEHRDECNTSMTKTHRYRKFMKEFNLPPGVSETDVTCSLEPNSIMKIEMTRKGCHCLDC